MNVLITGAGGQLAEALMRSVPTGVSATALSEVELDIRDAAAIGRAVARHAPTVIVNAAAYTAVDKAETEAKTAFAVNRDGARYLAEAAAARRLFLVHLSTDFVFDGETGHPYPPEANPRPISVYGASKYEGELAVRSLTPSAAIIRTSWVYAAEGRNFVLTMLRLMRERGKVRVVSDQIGTPTCADGLASCVWRVIERRAGGIWHWTDAGVASWYDFAVAIGECAVEEGLLSAPPVVDPVRSADYPTPARRPSYSVLEKSATWAMLDLRPAHWRDALRATLRTVARKAIHV